MKSPFVPTRAPLVLKCLLFTTLILSLFSSFLGPFLVLSKEGISHYYFWQFLTYLFVHPFPSGIFQLALNLYVIWIFGAALIERIHPSSFLALYLGTGIFSGVLAWASMFVFPSAALAGSSPALFAILMAWIILNPTSELLFLFAYSFKTRSFLLSLLGLGLLFHLSRATWTPLFAEIGALIFGYLFTVIACKTHSPFHFLVPFEKGVFRLFELFHFRKHKTVKHAKIYDIQSGAPVLSDEEFMDTMLARISLYGEASLSPQEKLRMQQISEKTKR